MQLDGGVDIDNEHFSLGLSAFYNRMNDFIFYRKLESAFGGDSLVNVDGDYITAFQFDQQHAKLAGVEASIDIHPHPIHWLHFENTVSFVRGKFDNAIDGSSNLPLIPAARWISELRGDFKQAGKAFINAGIGSDIIRRDKKILFSLHFAVTNIANTAYQNHLSRLKYAAENRVTGRNGVFNTGRNFSLKLNVPLGFIKK